MQFALYEVRFWARVDWTSVRRVEDCWPWGGGRGGKGYGVARTLEGRTSPSHRIAYELLIGPIPDGLELDHLCRNRACVNPGHLEPVTHAENVRRSVRKLKTHCKHGHEFTPENTLWHRRAARERVVEGWARICRACQRDEWARGRRTRQRTKTQNV